VVGVVVGVVVVTVVVRVDVDVDVLSVVWDVVEVVVSVVVGLVVVVPVVVGVVDTELVGDEYSTTKRIGVIDIPGKGDTLIIFCKVKERVVLKMASTTGRINM
jgi:hypothetical protein